MSEMGCVLRYARGNALPVIHAENCFGLMPFLADMFGVDRDRLIPYEHARTLLVDRAIMPIPNAFYRSRRMFSVFADPDAAPARPGLRLYVSRGLASRSPGNEAQLEEALIRRGFTAVHPRFMPVAVQAGLFASAEMIVSPHGAGLTNILFTRPGTALIEMFLDSFVPRDFYLRSRHNDMPYGAVTHGDEVDIEALLSLIAAVPPRAV